MSYSQTLAVLARLQLDRQLRADFLQDPARALAPFQLSPAEFAALCRLPTRDVERIGRMADWHRVQRISEHVPWFDPHLRPDLDAVFARFAQRTPPQLVNRLEAVAFCAHIEDHEAATPPYLHELARYERTRIELAWSLRDPQATLRTEPFFYPVEALRELLKTAGWPDAAPSVTPTHLIFQKAPHLPATLIRPK